ncbi:hypothetical protein PQZ72_02325 [Candidatus Pelagibacter sp.]|nr:hypothetical protein [Candidatus Pelagibacter sp.]
MRYTALISLLIILIHTTSIKSEVITTNNLLDKNFDNGSWTGTADGRHGSNVIASEHNTYIQSNDISLKNDANLTELQIQNGYTTNHEFEYWHWNTYDSSVKSTVTITGANGETTTQIRNYNSSSCGSVNCGDYVTGSDTYTVLSSLQTDYDLSVRYDFTDSSNATENHYGVDLREPSLTVTYESDPFVLNEDIRDEIKNVLEKFKPEKEFIVKEEFKFVEIRTEPKPMEEPKVIEQYKTEPKIEKVYNEKPKKEIKSETKVADKITEEYKKEVSTEVTEQVSNNAKKEVIKEDTDKNDSKEVVKKDSKEEVKTKVSSTKTKTSKTKLDVIMTKVDAQVKDASKNLNIKNIIKLDAMQKDSVSLVEYNNTEFYKPKDIYLDQIAIFDNRSIYKNFDLVQYKNNDIIGIKNRTLQELNINKQRILIELKELKNG